jgi:hypothetical protein
MKASILRTKSVTTIALSAGKVQAAAAMQTPVRKMKQIRTAAFQERLIRAFKEIAASRNSK